MNKHSFFISKRKFGKIPVWALTSEQSKSIDASVSKQVANWAKITEFTGEKNQLRFVPGASNRVKAILYGLGNDPCPMEAARLSRILPKGNYYFASKCANPELTALGWCLGAYNFDRYKKKHGKNAILAVDEEVDIEFVRSTASATYLTRDLINTPASDMGPEELENAVRQLAKTHEASVSSIRGNELIRQNFAMIHAVGRAAGSPPRLIDMRWGKTTDRKITLVGKGVCFDSGGLNIKPGNSMALMKKDMGGAANILGLAQMIMSAKLPVCLRVLIPAVENSIASDAFRPGDILESRKGLSVEIGHTDAEGRLILADALCYADEEEPELLVNMATLTGAARSALGPDLPPFYTHDDNLADEMEKASEKTFDPLWRMPLWQPYNTMMTSGIADINHISNSNFAGSIIAALFLSRFVERTKHWIHLDIFGWTPKEKPWASTGGEAQGIRALFEVIRNRYG